eukprot:jgi/Botrbrau1/12979/Bobra.384_1s0005.2
MSLIKYIPHLRRSLYSTIWRQACVSDKAIDDLSAPRSHASWTCSIHQFSTSELQRDTDELQWDLPQEAWHGGQDTPLRSNSHRSALSNDPRSPEFRSFNRNLANYNNFLRSIIQAKEGYKLVDVWEEMELDGVRPDLETFKILVSGCTRTSRMGDLMFFWGEFRRRGFQPSVQVYTSVIACCCRCGAMELGLKYFEEAKQQGMAVGAAAYLSLIGGAAFEGSYEKCEYWIQEMEAAGFGVTPKAYALAINSYQHNKRFLLNPEAVPAIQRLVEIGSSLPGPTTDSPRGREYQDADAESLWEDSGDESSSGPAGPSGDNLPLKAAIRSLSILGFHEEVVELVGDMYCDPTLDPSFRSSIAASLIDSYLDEAQARFRREVVHLLRRPELGPFTEEEREELRQLAKPEDLHKAIDVMRGALEDGLYIAHDKAYKAVMLSLRMARAGFPGTYETAISTLAMLISNPRYYTSVEWGSRLMLEACAQELPNLDLAHALWDEVVQERRVLVPRAQDMYLNSLMERQPDDTQRIHHVKKVKEATQSVVLHQRAVQRVVGEKVLQWPVRPRPPKKSQKFKAHA